MSKSEILNMLAHSNDLKRVARNIAGSKERGEEIFQELFLILCRYDETKLLKSHEGKYSEYLCINIMSNLKHQIFRSETKIEFTNIENVVIPVDPYIQMETEKAIQEYENILKPLDNYLEQEINQANFYGLTLVKRWANGESYRTISRKTRIPKDSIAKTIQKEIKSIKEKCL